MAQPWVCFLLTVAALSATATAYGAEPLRAGATTQDTLDGLATQILRKDIQLMQMNTRCCLNNERESKLHKWTIATLSTCAYIANAGFRYNPGGNPLAQLSGARHFLTRSRGD